MSTKQVWELSDEQYVETCHKLSSKTGDEQLDYYYELTGECPNPRSSSYRQIQDNKYYHKVNCTMQQLAGWHLRKFKLGVLKDYNDNLIERVATIENNSADRSYMISLLEGEAELIEELLSQEFIRYGYDIERRNVPPNVGETLDLSDIRLITKGAALYYYQKVVLQQLKEEKEKEENTPKESAENASVEMPGLNKINHRFVLLHDLGIIQYLQNKWFTKLQEGDKARLVSLILGLDEKGNESIRGLLRDFQHDQPGKAKFSKVAIKAVRSQLASIGLTEFDNYD